MELTLSFSRWLDWLLSRNQGPTAMETHLLDQQARLRTQVADIARLAGALEHKSNNVDAFYVRTVGTALNDRMDTHAKTVREAQEAMEAKNLASWMAIERDVKELHVQIAETNDRLNKVIRNLRGIGESN